MVGALQIMAPEASSDAGSHEYTATLGIAPGALQPAASPMPTIAMMALSMDPRTS
jgi:hypothetical protein